MAALTFPLSLENFFETLPIQTATPDLGENLEMSETAGGEILTADLGPRLWKMDVSIRLGYYDEIEPLKARLNTLRRAGRSFLAYAIPSKAPRLDPNGTILGASTVLLSAVAVNNREINLSGLPAGYVLSVGDCLSFTYGSNPVRYAMHQVVQGATANGSGNMTGLEVEPPIRPGYALASVIRLIKPMFKAIILPGSTNPGTVGGQVIQGLSFSIQQTLR